MADRMTEHDDMARLREDFAKLGGDFKDLFDTAMDLGKHSAGTAKDKLDAGLVELKKAAKRARKQGEDAVEMASDKIKERPLTTVLVAFGVGILLGKLMDRR